MGNLFLFQLKEKLNYSVAVSVNTILEKLIWNGKHVKQNYQQKSESDIYSKQCIGTLIQMYMDIKKSLLPTTEKKEIFYIFCSNIQQFCGYIKQLPSLDEKSTKKKHITRKASKTEEDM